MRHCSDVTAAFDESTKEREANAAGGVREGFLEEVILELCLEEKAVAVKLGKGMGSDRAPDSGSKIDKRRGVSLETMTQQGRELQGVGCDLTWSLRRQWREPEAEERL